MSRYRKVQQRTWGDCKFKALSPIPPCGQGLWFYLLTGPRTTAIPGLFSAGPMAMAEDLDWDPEAFREAFQEVFLQGMAKADFKAKLVFIPKAIEQNKPESPNVVKSWGNEFDVLPECELKIEAYETLKSFICGLGEAFAKAFNEAFEKPSFKPLPKASPKTMPNQEQEQEQEQYIRETSETDASDSPPDGDESGGDKPDPPKKKSKVQQKFTDEQMQIAQRLANDIRHRNPVAKIPKSLDAWANDIRLLNERDKVPIPMITKSLDYLSHGSFWTKVILSAGNLRDKFPQIYADMTEKGFLSPSRHSGFDKTNYQQGLKGGDDGEYRF